MITNPKFSLILSIIAISLSLMTILNVHFQKPVFAYMLQNNYNNLFLLFFWHKKFTRL